MVGKMKIKTIMGYLFTPIMMTAIENKGKKLLK
jgi:hypothetical protein